MHEVSLAEDILDKVATYVAVPEAVREIHLTVGPLAGVSVEALEFGFSAIAPGRGYTKARLVVHQVPVRLRCVRCGAVETVDTEVWDSPCGTCGSHERAVFSGSEFLLNSIEVEE